jgi:hypothetical protein
MPGAVWKRQVMPRARTLHPTTEHDHFLTLFITNGGGW